MKKLILLFLAAAPVLSFSQALPNNIRTSFTMDRIAQGATGNIRGNDLVGIAAPPGRVLGNAYLDTKWNLGSIMIAENEKMVEGILMKYNIIEQSIEVKVPSGKRILDAKKIGSLTWIDSLTKKQRFFVNADKYTKDGVPLVGLLEILSDGEKTLFQKTEIKVKQPNYNQALDAGTRDTKVEKAARFYYNVGNELIEIKNKKGLLVAFGEHAEDVNKFIKLNRIGTGNARDLTVIFEYYNTKLRGS